MKAERVLPGVWHIQGDMDVCMTLIEGEKRALLVDAGYGLGDLAAFVRTLTQKPLTVILTHGHHDHALGARCFDETYLFADDLPDFATFTGPEQRAKVAQQAQAKGVAVLADYLTAPIPVPKPLEEGELDLGGLTAQVIHCPGHTPGSAVVYVPQLQLLLTADDWNPCTWLFFPAALPAEAYRENVRALLQLPFTHVLCSHRTALYERAVFEDFLNGLTDDCLRNARKVDMGWPIDTREASPAEGQIFVFDWNKTKLEEKA